MNYFQKNNCTIFFIIRLLVWDQLFIDKLQIICMYTQCTLQKIPLNHLSLHSSLVTSHNWRKRKLYLIGYDLSQVYFWSRQFKEQGTSFNAYYICIIVWLLLISPSADIWDFFFFFFLVIGLFNWSITHKNTSFFTYS
jgi:hypothetical protein